MVSHPFLGCPVGTARDWDILKVSMLRRLFLMCKCFVHVRVPYLYCVNNQLTDKMYLLRFAVSLRHEKNRLPTY